MANTIDERIVKMQFDNTQFEKNVQTSLGTLGKLKEALRFDKVDMSGIASNIEKITDKVTSMGGIWDAALNRISNKIVDVGQSIASAFVFKPPSDGFNEYELKMDSLKVIMESSHESMETVNKYLNELNKYSDQTIYSFSDMTASIGKFTNAGVDLDTSVNAIKGIANEAALAGASTQDASRAMYNFAQALSAGSVKLIDWKSIENANMATQDFKNELISTAVELGTLTKVGDKYVSTTTNMQGKISDAFDASQGFNDSLAHQWMTTDVLTKTLGRYADESTDVGKRATQAATEVRTFSAMMDALKEAVGSGWAQTWEILFGNMEEATQLWTSVNNVLSGFIDKFSDARNNLLQGWKDLGGRTKLLEGLANVFQIISNVIKPFSDAMKVLIPPMTAEKLVELTTKFADFTEKIKKATETFGLVTSTMEGHVKNFLDFTTDGTDEAAGKTVDNLDRIKEAVKSVVNGDYGNDQARFDALREAGFDPEEIQDYVNKVHELSNGSWDLSDEMLESAATALGYTKTAGDAAKESTDTATSALSEYETEVSQIMSNGNILTQILVTAGQMVKDVFGSGLKILGAVKQAWTESFSPIKITLEDVTKFHRALTNLSGSLKISDETLVKIKNTVKDFFTAFKTTVDLVVKFAMKNLPAAIQMGQSVARVIGGIAIGIASFASGAASAIAKSDALTKILDAASSIIQKLSKGFEIAAEVFKYFGEKISDGVKYISNYFKLLGVGTKVASALDRAFGKSSSKFDEFKKKLSEKFGFKNLDEFKSKMDAVFDRMSKDFLIPGLQRFTGFVMDLLDGKASLGKLLGLIKDFGKGVVDFFKSIVFPKDNAFVVANKEVDKLVGNATRLQGIGKIFKALGEGPFNFFKNLISPEQKNGFEILGDEADSLVKKASMLQKVNGFAKTLGENIRNAFENIDLKSIGGTIVSKLQSVFNAVKSVVKSFFEGLTGKGGDSGSIANSIPNTIFGSITKITDRGAETVGKLQQFGGTLKDAIGNIQKPFERGNVGKGFKDFTTALNDADKVVPVTLGDKLHNLAVDVKRFIAEIDYKKLLTFARTIKVFTSILNGIKLTKSFSGMADNIGGFFKGLSEDGLKINAIPEESKFTKLVKVAIAVALVAKAMSMIADIPEDRLQSSVGVVAGIAGVMTVIVILLEKMKVAEGADLGGAAKTMIALAASVYIIAKAMEMLGDADPAALIAGGIAVGALMFVLTKAAKSLKDLKLDTADALAPLGFALALRMLVKAVLTLGEADEKVLLQGGIATVLAIEVLKRAVQSLKKLKANGAAVFAPIAFTIALGMLVAEIALLGIFPVLLLAKGMIAVAIAIQILKGAAQSLKKLKLSPADALAPIAFAVAIGLLMGAVAVLGLMPKDMFVKGALCVMALGGILAAFLAIQSAINKFIGGEATVTTVMSMIAFAAAIDLLALGVVVLALIPEDRMWRAVDAIMLLGVVVGALALFLAIASDIGGVDNSNIVALGVAIGGIVVLGITAALLGILPQDRLLNGVLAVAVLGALLTAIVFAFAIITKVGGEISPSLLIGAVAIVLALVVLGEAAAILGVIPTPVIWKGVGVIAALAAILTASVAILGVVSEKSNIGPGDIFAMIVIVLALQALGITAALLGAVPTPQIVKGVAVLGILSAFLAGMTFLLGYLTFSVTDILALVAIVGAVMVLVAAVKILGSMDTGEMAQGTVGVIALLTGLAVALGVLCGMAGGILVLAASFALFGAGALMIGAGFMLVADGVMKLVMAMTLLSLIDTKSLLMNLLVFAPVLMVVVAAFAGLAAVALLLGPAVLPILGLAAAFALLGAGLYLIVSAIEKFVGIAGNVGEAVANMAAFVAEHLGDFLTGIKNAVLNGLKFLASNIGPFLKKGGELIAGAAKGIQEHGPEVLSKVGDAVTKALKWIISHLPDWLKAGVDLLTKLISGIGSMGGKLLSKARELITKAKDAVLKKKDEFFKAGKNLIAGLISGVKEKARDLVDAAKGVVNNAIDAAKNLLRINSPSKVFRDMGYSIDEGFIVGMRGMSDDVAKSSEFVAQGIVDAAKDPLDYLADLMSGDIIDDPTITPVLDLSEIQNGANRLYSMMSDVDRYSLNGNIALANDASLSINRDQRRRQESENQMMGTLIDAINGLSALIGNTGNVYNVNGVTYDDGSNVSSAVRSLIRAAKIEGRA